MIIIFLALLHKTPALTVFSERSALTQKWKTSFLLQSFWMRRALAHWMRNLPICEQNWIKQSESKTVSIWEQTDRCGHPGSSTRMGGGGKGLPLNWALSREGPGCGVDFLLSNMPMQGMQRFHICNRYSWWAHDLSVLAFTLSVQVLDESLSSGSAKCPFGGPL